VTSAPCCRTQPLPLPNSRAVAVDDFQTFQRLGARGQGKAEGGRKSSSQPLKRREKVEDVERTETALGKEGGSAYCLIGT